MVKHSNKQTNANAYNRKKHIASTTTSHAFPKPRRRRRKREREREREGIRLNHLVRAEEVTIEH